MKGAREPWRESDKKWYAGWAARHAARGNDGVNWIRNDAERRTRGTQWRESDKKRREGQEWMVL